MYWGVTPALDFQEEYKAQCKPPTELNILIIGGSDARHILKTVSRSYQHEPIKINFYCTEICLELIGRQLLLLNIALQQPEQIGLRLKTKIFMELYGNTVVRPEVAKYLTLKAKQLVDMITNLDYCYKIMKNINLDGLKYKERDYLEVLFKYWCTFDPFLICKLWDRRLRQSLGVRYDSRAGVFDWDLHMRLHPAGATQLCGQEYKHWRETGVAFTWLESDVSKPNRTFVAGVVPSGEKYLHHGYLGDITSGPFIAYGLHCKNTEMLKKANHMNINRATDVTEYNLTHLFYEISNKEDCPYHNISNLKLGTIVVDLPNERIVENEINFNDLEFKQINETQSECINIENVTINFLSYSQLEQIIHKENYNKFFNIIYFSNLLIDKIDPNIINTISNSNCLLIIENQNYIPSNRTEQLKEFANKIKNKTTSIQNITELPFNPNKDCYAKFVIM